MASTAAGPIRTRIPARAWLAIALFVALFIGCSAAWPSDACSRRAVVTAAEVTVSDGTAFSTRSYFQSRDAAAIRHMRESERVVAVEGPLSWASAGDDARLGSTFEKLFALGHQYHAFLLHFDELVDNPRDTDGVAFAGGSHRARSGDYPYGGIVHRIDGADASRPAGLVFEFSGQAPIYVSFSDWQPVAAVELPFVAEIDDGERVFVYRYTSVEIARRSPLWFFESVDAPALDPLLVYRLHRTLLAAHCLGDAALIADLSTGHVVSANNGRLAETPRAAVRERFASLFERLDYTAYHDLADPVIRLADSSDLGWIGVNVRAVGSDRRTGAAFDDRWAWLMIVRKVEGRWLHAANAASLAR